MLKLGKDKCVKIPLADVIKVTRLNNDGEEVPIQIFLNGLNNVKPKWNRSNVSPWFTLMKKTWVQRKSSM